MSTKANIFVETYGSYAKQAAQGTGIFPETILTAAALESGYAKSSLASVHYNFFGIKAGKSWTGKTITYNTKEQKADGTVYVVSAVFRKYDSPADSFKDYVKLLSTSRYVKYGVTTAKTPIEQFEKIKAAGYATDINYTTKLTKIFNSVTSWATTTNGIGILTGLAITAATFFF